MNAPYIFEVLTPYLSDKDKKYRNIFGRDQSIWEAALMETIDKNQLPPGLLEEHTVQKRLVSQSFSFLKEF